MMESRPKASDRVSVEYLRECFEYRDGALYWKTRPAHHFARPQDHATFIKKSAGRRAGRKAGDGYIDIKIRFGGYPACFGAHRVVWAMHHGKWPEQTIDHINRVRDDNRIENLRDVPVVVNTQNAANKRAFPSIRAYQHGRFEAQVGIGGVTSVHLGIFDTKEEALAHRQMVVCELKKVAQQLMKRTPRPATYRKRAVLHQSSLPPVTDGKSQLGK